MFVIVLLHFSRCSIIMCIFIFTRSYVIIYSVYGLIECAIAIGFQCINVNEGTRHVGLQSRLVKRV